jgi:hypothetical protein
MASRKLHRYGRDQGHDVKHFGGKRWCHAHQRLAWIFTSLLAAYTATIHDLTSAPLSWSLEPTVVNRHCARWESQQAPVGVPSCCASAELPVGLPQRITAEYERAASSPIRMSMQTSWASGWDGSGAMCGGSRNSLSVGCREKDRERA